VNNPPAKKVTLKALRDKKRKGARITAIGVYDAPMAAIADRIGFDLLIVDHAGPMSLLGHSDPTTVTFDEQLCLTRAVTRVAKHGLIVGQMPFLSYHASQEQAVANAGRMISEGRVDSVKCEGNSHTAKYVKEIVRAGIPVMAHIGMLPSRRTEQSGFGVKGCTAVEAAAIVRDALAFADAGAWGFIVEHVPTELSAHLTRTLDAPIVTLGAGCINDGVYHISGDVVGYSAFPLPRNRIRFSNVSSVIEDGLRMYRDETLAGTYPPTECDFHMEKGEHAEFLRIVGEHMNAPCSSALQP
jgi:3-methyl-2-oxobutanoate hydroxymethyltransferase